MIAEAPSQAVAEHAGLFGHSELCEAPRVDPDGEGACLEPPPKREDGTVAGNGSTEVPHDELMEIAHILVGLKADKVESRESFNQLAMTWQRRQRVGGGKRDVEEEAHRQADAETTEFLSHQQEMVVMNPDEVVTLGIRGELLRKPRVDSAVRCEIGWVEVDQIDAVVKQRPQSPVREAEVVSGMFSLG